MRAMKTCLAVVAVTSLMAGSASAQAPGPAEAEQIRARQRISTMEVILERAVSNGADNVLRQVSNVMPDRPMLSGTPQARGIRLDGIGVIFNVQVPGMMLPIMWPYRQMVNDTQIRSAERALQQLQEMRRFVGGLQGDAAVQLGLMIRATEAELGQPAQRPGQLGRVSASSLAAPVPPAVPNVDQAVVDDPQAAYTHEVKESLITAMLENNQSLAIKPDEWLIVTARDDERRNPLFPGDTVDVSTWIAKVKGSDLAAVRAGTLSLADARKRVEVKEN